MARSSYPKPTDETADTKRHLPRRKMMTVVLDDGTVHTINIGRPSLRRMFAIAHDGREPDGEFDAYWMLWHAVGRPGDGANEAGDVAAFIDSIAAEDIHEEDVEIAASPTSPA